MRINDKHLCRIASGNTPIDKEGYLLKRGEVNKSFQKRWFVLKGNLLFYFDKKGEKEPTGVIIIEGCTVELAEMTDAFTFELVFPGSTSRTYILAALSQEDMESWMKAITCASYDYMKLMVAELQRQLDEFNTEQKMRSNQGSTSSNSQMNPLYADNHQNLMDPFASPEVKSKDFQPVYPRLDNHGKTFEQLHEEYGLYIMQKMREAKVSSA